MEVKPIRGAFAVKIESFNAKLGQRVSNDPKGKDEKESYQFSLVPVGGSDGRVGRRK